MAENKQSQRSREWIADALIALMEKKPYSQISIKDITDKAGVARLTFYRHFEAKEDILRYHFHSLFSGYLVELDASGVDNFLDALTLCFSYWRENGQQARMLVNNHLDSLLYEPFGNYLETMLDKYHAEKKLLSVQKQFLIGGLYFAMIDYIIGDSPINPNQVAKSVLEMLKLDIDSNCWQW